MKLKQRIYDGQPKYLKRLIAAAIAILATLAAVIISAMLLGEFIWHV